MLLVMCWQVERMIDGWGGEGSHDGIGVENHNSIRRALIDIRTHSLNKTTRYECVHTGAEQSVYEHLHLKKIIIGTCSNYSTDVLNPQGVYEYFKVSHLIVHIDRKIIDRYRKSLKFNSTRGL